jgi:hypothetical protein
MDRFVWIGRFVESVWNEKSEEFKQALNAFGLNA